MNEELKDNIVFPPFIFSSPCRLIIKLILQEKRQMQIAEQLGIKIQNVYYYINKLVKAGIAERGIRTSYSEVYIKDSLKEQLKEKISQFEEAKFVNLNCHSISVHWPIIQDSNYQFGKERIRWRSNLREKIIKVFSFL